jgi:hypothetical protein
MQYLGELWRLNLTTELNLTAFVSRMASRMASWIGAETVAALEFRIRSLIHGGCEADLTGVRRGAGR